jgi:Rrf2 family protein
MAIKETSGQVCGSSVRSGTFHLTKMSDYGFFLLGALLQAGSVPLSIRGIAKKYSLSFSFLQKVAHFLKKAGLITAHRGKEGGYILAKDPKEISLQNIIEALEGPVVFAQCLRNKNEEMMACPRQNVCFARKGIQKITNNIRKRYLSKSLYELCS